MFKNPFSFSGRIGRKEYGITFIIYVVLNILIRAIAEEGGGGALILFIILIPMVWFFWAQGAKRCHDINTSGWYQIIPFYFLILIFRKGIPGDNEYVSSPNVINGDAPLDYTEIQHSAQTRTGAVIEEPRSSTINNNI